MNLSYPANFFGSAAQTGAIGTYGLAAVYPTGMSYGCLKPETIGTTTYPNTSCVDDTGLPIDPAICSAVGGKCAGFGVEQLERIYWQKNSANKWQAGYSWSTVPLPAQYVDWGDNLEGRTWPLQVLRVETNTFSSLPEVNPSLNDPRLRFDMWHVYGQGKTELWGAHATSESAATAPYVYAGFPYAVNVTSTARLNIAKLDRDSAACPATATDISQSPHSPVWRMNGSTGSWAYPDPENPAVFIPVPHTKDLLYGAELNIKGSYVYGYNWNLRSEAVPAGISKAGWWRLTFYTPDMSVDFGAWVGRAAGGLAPPLSGMLPAPMSTAAVTAEEGESGLLLYVPQIDATNQLTYLDVCIKEGNAGGGKGK